MKKILSLYTDVITSPEKAFNRIRDEKPFFAGVIILFLQLVFVSLFYFLLSDLLEYSFTGLGMIMSMLQFLARLFITVFFVDYVAKSIYKVRSNYSSLLVCWFFAYIPSVIFLFLSALLIVTDLVLSGTVNFITNYFFLFLPVLLGFLIWLIALEIKAVRAVHGLSTVKTIISYVLGTILALIVMSLWP